MSTKVEPVAAQKTNPAQGTPQSASNPAEAQKGTPAQQKKFEAKLKPAGTPATGLPAPTAADSRRDASPSSSKLTTGKPVPRGYKGKSTVITLHGSLVPPNSKIQVSSSKADVAQTGWKGMTVHDNSKNDLASRTPGALQFTVPTGPDGKWSGEVRVLETKNSNGVLYIKNAGTSKMQVTGTSVGKNVPITLNNKNTHKPIIRAHDPQIAGSAPVAAQNRFLSGHKGALNTIMNGDLRPTLVLESTSFRQKNSQMLTSKMGDVSGFIKNLPPTKQGRAKKIAYQTVQKGGTVGDFIKDVIAYGESTRNDIRTKGNNAYNALVSETNPLLNPSFLSSSLDQLVSGGVDFAGKLKSNVESIASNLRIMHNSYKHIENTALATENNNSFNSNRNTVIKRLTEYYEGAASTMTRVIGDHKGMLSALKQKEKEASWMAAFSFVASIGSIGFGYSNALAVRSQVASKRAAATPAPNPGPSTSAAAAAQEVRTGGLIQSGLDYLKAPNAPALFGSGTLLANNLNAGIRFASQEAEIAAVKADWQAFAGGLAASDTNTGYLDRIGTAQTNLKNTFATFQSYLFKYTDRREFFTTHETLPEGVSTGQFIPAQPPEDNSGNFEIGSIYSKHTGHKIYGGYRGQTRVPYTFYVKHTWYSQDEPSLLNRWGDPNTTYGRDWDV